MDAREPRVTRLDVRSPHRHPKMRTCAFAVLIGLALNFGAAVPVAQASSAAVDFEFADSATGYSLQPDEVVVHPNQDGSVSQENFGARTGADGHAKMQLQHGRHTISASLRSHHSVSGDVQIRENFPYRVHFLLDPLEKPRELQPDYIEARRRDDATLFQGFVVSDESGKPVGGVRIKSTPSGVTATTDDRGYYELHIPLSSAANLVIEQAGYRTEERQFLELSPRGDWTYNFRLTRGSGTQTLDERTPLRRAVDQDPLEEPTASSGSTMAPKSLVSPKATLPANATIRVPRNIRVQDGTNLYYVSMDFYEKHTLPHEWISSWNTNSLNAGSVAVRCYAIARINGRGPDTDFDICGDSDCQNFKATVSASSTDKAVDYTSGYVVINSNGNIPTTEYSAENNSLGLACGDGFTAPTGGCLYDPICAGHDRSGHGRGMCQRGTHRWGAGGNGYPVRDWVWMINHYYPTYKLVKGAVLVVGDDVKSTSSDCSVRACAGGGIESGVVCPLITSKASGQTGVIIGGPLLVTNDNKGFTWYQVRWNDGGSTTGWSCENYLERVVAGPSAPTGLTATAASSARINLSWLDSSNIEAGFYVERAIASSGPWLQIGTVAAGVTSYADQNLYPGSTWFYRVRSYNSAGTSSYSATVNATTPNTVAPTLAPIANRVVTPGTLITFTNTASAPENVKLITDFDAFQSEMGNGAVLFNTPNNSTSTTNSLNRAPEMDVAAVTDTYPAGGLASGNVLMMLCEFTNANNPWVRLTTAGTDYFADPVIDITKKLRFDIYADQPVQVAVGCREATIGSGTAIGSDGGTSGAIEWVGVTNISGTAPMATRTIAANTWTTLTFDFANEPIRSFASGNGVLTTTSGLAVLEHLAMVPGNGTNVYRFYLDNFSVLYPRTFTYSLGVGAPAGATVDANTGVFSWTPSLSQSPSTNTIAVVVTDNSSPPLRTTNSFTVTVSQSSPTVIISQPQNATANQGSDASFVVDASGTSLKYQWLFNATNVLVGKTNATLTLTNCQLSNAGSYTVIVSNTSDSITSSAATLVVLSPIVITTAPANRTNNIGDNAQFTVAATGTTLGYQWQFKGVDIAGATDTAINIAVNDVTNEGIYTVVVSSPVSTNVSASATLVVPYFELSKIAQWNFNSEPADNNLDTGRTTPSLGSGSVAAVGGATGLFGDSVASDPASLGLDNTSWLITNYPSSGTGNKIRGIQVNASTVGYDQIVITWEQRNNARASRYARFQYTTNGTDWIDGDVISDSNYANFQFKSSDLSDVPGVGNNANFAFRVLTEWQSTATGTGASAYVPSNPSSTYNTDAVIRFDMITVLGSIAEPVIVSQPQSVTQQAGQTAVFNVAATGINLTYRWQKDGVDLQNDERISGANTATLTISNVSDGDAGAYSAIVSVADGLFLTQTDPASLFVFTPVAITQQPQAAALNAGSSVTLNVTATGTAPITYQWKKDGNTLIGATASSLAINNFQVANAGTYTVVLSNGGAPIESDPAVLSINVAPSISVQPHSITVIADNSVSLAVTASGTAPLVYQWRKNGAPIVGATQSAYTLASTKLTDAASYSVIITNVAGSVTSSTAILAVTMVKPVIVSQPVGRTNVVGSSATFNVGATGGALGYQWRKNGAKLLNDGKVFGATSASLTIVGVYTTDNAIYSVAVSNSAGSVVSSGANFKAFFAPAIAVQPLSRTNAAGSTATFKVSAVGTTPLKYQWRKGSTDLVGATGATLTLTAVSSQSVGDYTVIVSNVVGSATSDSATLAVDTKPLITSQPASRTGNEGTTVTFHVGAIGGDLVYQWLRGTNLFDDGNISGSLTDTLTLSNINSKDAALNYSVKIKNAAGSATSTSAGLTVILPARITSGPTNQLVLYNANATFAAITTGTAPVFFQWYKNNTNKLANFAGRISGATGSALTISSCVEGDVASYSVVVSNVLGSVTSSNALLRIVPKIAITSPAANAAFTVPTVQVKGTASDLSGSSIAQVQWQLNGGAFSTASGTTNWSASVSLRAGTNVLGVKAINAAGIESGVLSRVFLFNVSKPLTLTTSGAGTVSGAANGQLLLVGRSYKVTALPGSGQVFSNWTGTISSSSNALTFIMESNTTLVANFASNPFIPRAGVYNGLFYDTNAPSHYSAGFFSFTLASSGAYSGSCYVGGLRYRFVGKFDISGESRVVFALAPKATFDLTLDFSSPSSGLLYGTVTGTSWIAQLSGGRAKFLYSPPAPQSGSNYTVAFIGSSDGLTSPGGDGFGNLTVSTSGQVGFSGRMPDDSALVPPLTYITGNGDWPVYIPLYGGKGSVFGWLTNSTGQPRSYEGTVHWIKTGAYGTTYPSGFTNQSVAVSSVLPSLASGIPAFNSPNAMVVFSDGLLTTPITNYISLNNNVVSVFEGQTNGLTLSLTKSTGQWLGSINNPSNAVKMTVRGVLLKDQNQARGYFVGPRSGYFLVEPY